jgi:hypothetical protein
LVLARSSTSVAASDEGEQVRIVAQLVVWIDLVAIIAMQQMREEAMKSVPKAK